MKLRSQIIRLAYWILAVCVAIVCIASILETTRFSNRFTDIAPFLLIPLFVVLPIAGLTLFFLNRKCRDEHTRAQRLRLHAARIIILIGWVISCIPAGYIILLFRLWPVSLLDGPNTNYARAGFEQEAGFKPPASVSKIYYRSVGGLMDGNNYLRFQVTSPDVVQRIVAYRKMTRTNEWRMMKSSSGPKWWREKRDRQGLECYSRKEKLKCHWYLWYDPETGTVWYEEFDL